MPYNIPAMITYSEEGELSDELKEMTSKSLDDFETDPYGVASSMILTIVSLALEFEGVMNDREEGLLQQVREVIQPLPNPNL